MYALSSAENSVLVSFSSSRSEMRRLSNRSCNCRFPRDTSRSQARAISCYQGVGYFATTISRRHRTGYGRRSPMLQLYGNARSRAMRCLWMLEEVGQPYQLIEKSTRTDELQSVEYIRLNPNARIPTLVDGDLVLWESMAINLSAR